jgi:peroxiredoxin Q/BCP
MNSKRNRFTLLLALGGLMLFGLVGRAAELEVGAALPAVEAKNQDGALVDLAADAGDGWTLVYFYPKADTPGCTKQACSLRDAYAKLTERDVRIYGVSSDSVADQKAFQQKYRLPFTLLADVDRKIIEAFGVPHKLGFASRQAFLFRDGELVWRDRSASTSEQAADVLAAIEEPGADT